MMNLKHVDTCPGSYLIDHRNREHELLLGTPVDGATLNTEVAEGLLDEFHALAPAGLSVEAFKNALHEAFPKKDMLKRFDHTLEVVSEADREGDIFMEEYLAWFLLTWDEEEEC